jgi:hypothetical protein
LVDVLLAHELANIGYKNKLELVVGHWHAKKLAAIQTHMNFLVIAIKLVRYSLVAIQTRHLSPLMRNREQLPNQRPPILKSLQAKHT